MKHFIFGDLHGDKNGELFALKKYPFFKDKELTKDNILFQLGDFGYYWYYPKVRDLFKKDQFALDFLAKQRFSTLIIPGNHENYDLIYSLPLIEKWGGLVYEDKRKEGSIYIAKHGEIYTINNKKIFVYGGAKSSDIEDRCSIAEVGTYKIIDKYRYGVEYIGRRKVKVKLGKVDFWEKEIPSWSDQLNALYNLSLYNFKVDYVMTHTSPKQFVSSFISKEDSAYSVKLNCPVAYFLDNIFEKVEFKQWFFGHFHVNKTIQTNKGDLICHYKTKPIEINF